MRLITTEERRARLAERHRLATAADSVGHAADDVVVLHATDPASVFLSVWARMDGVEVADIEAALYERRALLRTLAMRRTLFVASLDALPAVERSSSIDVAANERKRFEQFLADSGIDDPRRWLAEAYEAVLDALADGGLSARALTTAAPILATRVLMGAGTKWAAEVGATSRVLGLMAVEGQIARGRPAGNWTGRQYEWHRRDRWLPGGSPDGDGHPMGELDPEQAAAELVRRWLDRFGPGTLTDLAWWTGWTKTKTRRALTAVDAEEVGLDGERTGYVRPGDAGPPSVAGPGADPWVALLPSLDPTPMGWKERHWYLGDHEAHLFDRNGNIGPTVWADGRIVGGWGQRPDGEVVVELLEDVGADHCALVEAETARLAEFVGDVVVKPSFPTPLQKRLAGGTGPRSRR